MGNVKIITMEEANEQEEQRRTLSCQGGAMIIRRLCEHCNRRLKFRAIDDKKVYLYCPTCGRVYAFIRG